MAWPNFAHRADLSADRVRVINRLRTTLLSYFPALERAFDFAGALGPLKLLLGFRTPQALREIGRSKLVSLAENPPSRASQQGGRLSVGRSGAVPSSAADERAVGDAA